MHYSRYIKLSCTCVTQAQIVFFTFNLNLSSLLVGARRADQNKVSALQSRSPSRKIVGKAAARHPRPALLHASARRKATGEHQPPGAVLWIERVQPVFNSPAANLGFEPGN